MVMTIIFALLIGAMFLAVVRLILGPSLPDRVVALDLMGMLSIGLISAFAVASDQQIFIDAALVLALIGFLSTVAFAYFIEKGELPWRRL